MKNRTNKEGGILLDHYQDHVKSSKKTERNAIKIELKHLS
jgi:hypothetical protein